MRIEHNSELLYKALAAKDLAGRVTTGWWGRRSSLAIFRPFPRLPSSPQLSNYLSTSTRQER